ncbi:MAG TPA: CHC2 zinc finger domain-containing protein [Rhodoblastus sp.]|nr:CHC2 zinc finger domain-containing protein [Rhodoblastus sp.]
MRLSEAQIDELKERVDLVKLAADLGATMRRHGRAMMGSCPLCGGSARTTRFEIKGQKWVCAACSEGGDALALVQKVRGLDFRSAVEFLGGAKQIDPEEAARLERERLAREKRAAEIAARKRAEAISSARGLWMRAEQFSREDVEKYLKARGCLLPKTAEIRGARAVPYCLGEVVDEIGRKSPRVLFRGPAMIAAVRDNDGEIIAVHRTYLNAECTGKAVIPNPDGDDKPLVPKKQLGAKKGGHIVLRAPKIPMRLFMGEGIETVLSVATAYWRAEALRPGDAFWSSCDLGNLGGDALESVKHPTLRHKNGHVAKVPGPEPDMAVPGIAIPNSVRELILLGDGDSDPFTTRMAMERARARYSRDGLVVRVAMAPRDMDFNDVLMGSADERAGSAPAAC